MRIGSNGLVLISGIGFVWYKNNGICMKYILILMIVNE